jgi:hypothetical protein
VAYIQNDLCANLFHIPVGDLIWGSFDDGSRSEIESLLYQGWKYKVIQISIPFNSSNSEVNITASMISICCLMSVLNLQKKCILPKVYEMHKNADPLQALLFHSLLTFTVLNSMPLLVCFSCVLTIQFRMFYLHFSWYLKIKICKTIIFLCYSILV